MKIDLLVDKVKGLINKLKYQENTYCIILYEVSENKNTNVKKVYQSFDDFFYSITNDVQSIEKEKGIEIDVWEFDKPTHNFKDLSLSKENDSKMIDSKDKNNFNLQDWYKTFKGNKKLSEEQEKLERIYHICEVMIDYEIQKGHESLFLKRLINKKRNLTESELSRAIVKAYESKFELRGRRVSLYL